MKDAALKNTLATQGKGSPYRAEMAVLPQKLSQPGPALLQLQRLYGNRYVQRMVAQRQAEEEDALQAKAIQRQPEEGEEIQAKAVQRVGLEGGPVAADVQAGIQRARSGGQPLEAATQKQMSASLGYDFSGVRVHTDANADQLNRQLSARAFTTGNDVFFQQGAYNPTSNQGQELIAHELSHVIQQNTGRVNGNGSGMTVRPAGDVFEQEADALARKLGAGAVCGEGQRSGMETHNTLQQKGKEQPAGGQSTQPGLNTPTSIQRDIGFEFEVTDWRMKHEKLDKNIHVLDGSGWYLQADTLGEKGFDPEFVVEKVPETLPDGMKKLDTALDDMGSFLDKLNTIQKPTAVSQVGGGGKMVNDAIIDHQKSELRGDPQVTVGVQFSRLPSLLADLGNAPKNFEEDGGGIAYQQLMGKNFSPAAALRACAKRAKECCMKSEKRIKSEAYEGVIALMGSYIAKAHIFDVGYAKQMADVMSRTDFVSALAQTEWPKSSFWKEWRKNSLLKDVLYVVNRSKGDEHIFGKKYKLEGKEELKELVKTEPWWDITIEQWIDGLANNKDILSAKYNEHIKKSVSTSLGAKGTEAVGPELEKKTRPQGIILELREIKKRIPYKQWKPFAKAILEHIARLNDLTKEPKPYEGVKDFGK